MSEVKVVILRLKLQVRHSIKERLSGAENTCLSALQLQKIVDGPFEQFFKAGKNVTLANFVQP